nr:IceA2 protein [Helicobacter pylori]
MAVVVKVVNGKIQEFENGIHKRTYGSNIVAADTDGHIVAAVTAKGKVEEYENGIHKRTY